MKLWKLLETKFDPCSCRSSAEEFVLSQSASRGEIRRKKIGEKEEETLKIEEKKKGQNGNNGIEPWGRATPPSIHALRETQVLRLHMVEKCFRGSPQEKGGLRKTKEEEERSI